MFYSPLEQFEVGLVGPFTFSFFGLFDIAVTSGTAYSFLSFSIFCFILLLAKWKLFLIPNRFQSLGELLYVFIFGMVKDQAGLKGQPYFPIFFLTFGYILFCNLLGLTPYAFTPTSHISITFLNSFLFFVGLIIIGFKRQGKVFLTILVPSGVPIFILPLMILIEAMSFFIRPISLSVRLFANMLAGHTLLHIVAGFGVKLLKANFFIGMLPLILLLAITTLEFGIAFLQAYVFAILLAIYLKDSIKVAH